MDLMVIPKLSHHHIEKRELHIVCVSVLIINLLKCFSSNCFTRLRFLSVIFVRTQSSSPHYLVVIFRQSNICNPDLFEFLKHVFQLFCSFGRFMSLTHIPVVGLAILAAAFGKRSIIKHIHKFNAVINNSPLILLITLLRAYMD